jgi:hypothetical protein
MAFIDRSWRGRGVLALGIVQNSGLHLLHFLLLSGGPFSLLDTVCFSVGERVRRIPRVGTGIRVRYYVHLVGAILIYSEKGRCRNVLLLTVSVDTHHNNQI